MRTNARVTASRSLFGRVTGFYAWCNDTFGERPTMIGAALIMLALSGGLLSIGNDDRAAVVSSIPDGISAECHAQLIRTHFSESSVERFEQANAPTVSSDGCGALGTVK